MAAAMEGLSAGCHLQGVDDEIFWTWDERTDQGAGFAWSLHALDSLQSSTLSKAARVPGSDKRAELSPIRHLFVRVQTTK